MKTLTILTVLVLCGCSNLPKDTYVRDGKVIINTPWGPSSIEGAVFATGKAAIEAAIEAAKQGTVIKFDESKK